MIYTKNVEKRESLMHKKSSLFMLVAVCTVAFSGCSDALEQYSSEQSSVNVASLKKNYGTIPTDVEIERVTEEFVDEEKEKVLHESQQPVFYGLGGGGITFKTTYAQATAILSKPKLARI